MNLPLRESRADTARGFAQKIVSRGFDGAPNLLVATLSQSLASRIAEATAPGGRVAPVLEWLQRTCTDIPLDDRAAHMLRSAIANISDSPIESDEARNVLAILDAAIRDALDRSPQNTRPHQAPDDELDGAIATFLIRLDDADALSAEHSRAVSLWCRRLATRLNLEPATAQFVARCGMLHDVGKATTPLDILQARRALSESEWTVMRDHPVAGARMLAHVERLRPFERAARSHHERLDGKGYPDKLQAREIPLFVRIVTVADAFNAMIGRRPYRLPLSPAHALEQLVKHRNSQFDSSVVDAMIDVVEHSV